MICSTQFFQPIFGIEHLCKAFRSWPPCTTFRTILNPRYWLRALMSEQLFFLVAFIVDHSHLVLHVPAPRHFLDVVDFHSRPRIDVTLLRAHTILPQLIQ